LAARAGFDRLREPALFGGQVVLGQFGQARRLQTLGHGFLLAFLLAFLLGVF
jgi:hypothetical protein